MNAVVVYESHWGNTAAVAQATWVFLAIGFALGFIALFWLRQSGQMRLW